MEVVGEVFVLAILPLPVNAGNCSWGSRTPPQELGIRDIPGVTGVEEEGVVFVWEVVDMVEGGVGVLPSSVGKLCRLVRRKRKKEIEKE